MHFGKAPIEADISAAAKVACYCCTSPHHPFQLMAFSSSLHVLTSNALKCWHFWRRQKCTCRHQQKLLNVHPVNKYSLLCYQCNSIQGNCIFVFCNCFLVLFFYFVALVWLLLFSFVCCFSLFPCCLWCLQLLI